MGNGNKGNDRIEFLKQKERDIRAALAVEMDKRARCEKREAERLQFLIGGAALQELILLNDDVVGNPKEAEARHRALNYQLVRMETLAERDKKLLRAKGWL
jgi:hypothetical protein